MRIISKYIFLCLAVLALLLLAACGTAKPKAKPKPKANPLLGGPCKYVKVPGTAVIRSIEVANPRQPNCTKDPVRIVFDFIPRDPKAPYRYRFPLWEDKGQELTVAGGMNPPRQWALSQGLFTGARRPCIRRELIQGTCTPVIFELPGLDMKKGADMCFGR